jgi:hypothetical protein
MPNSTADKFFTHKHGKEQFLSREAITKLMEDYAESKFQSFKMNRELYLNAVNFESKRGKTNQNY